MTLPEKRKTPKAEPLAKCEAVDGGGLRCLREVGHEGPHLASHNRIRSMWLGESTASGATDRSDSEASQGDEKGGE